MFLVVADLVWKALADPTRRELIERMAERARTTGELCEAFPSLSRFAVMKHLSVLEEAQLVSIEREGRVRWNRLRPDPLREANRWLAAHIEGRKDMLLRLKAVAEEES